MSDSEAVHDDLVLRILGEFHEMPGLRLTLEQAARLMHLEIETARAALTALVNCGALVLRDGQYRRA